jgi:hypothetical protein
MIQAKVFHSIVTNNKKLARNIFINNRGQLDKILRKSRLKNLFLELVELRNKEKESFFNLKKDVLLRNQLIVSEILNLSENFNKFDIHFVFLKGAASIFQIERSKSVRYLSDIDVLIDIKDINKLHIMLKKIGIKHYFDISHDYMNSRKNHSLETIQLNSGINIDLHFRSSSPLDFNFCPFSKNFLKDFDVINMKGINVNVLNINQIYIFSLYQLFARDEINNCSSSIVDLILIESLYRNYIDEKYILFNENLKLKKFHSLWKSLTNLNLNNLKKFEKGFVIKIFNEPRINFSKRIKIIFLNLIYFKRSVREKYGIRAKTKKRYAMFIYDEFKKLLNLG